MNKYGWIWWVEWISTVILITGCMLTSINQYPANLYLSLIGNFGWIIVAIKWRKWSLLVIQAVVSVIYIAGIFNTW